jgi:hypothetical protein
MKRFARSIMVACLSAGVGSQACGQLPTATGRQWTLSNAAWKLFVPNNYQHRQGDATDLLVHFHGDPQTYWNNVAYADLNVAVLTVNYSGLSSAYTTPFSNASLFQTIIDEALAKLRAQSDFADDLQWNKVAVSSFSAGYGAVREIMKSSTYRSRIDALLAADSLYATTAGDGTPLDSQMVDYKTYASLAKTGSKTFLFSHSQVPTYTYESTQECGDELMQSLGVSASAYNVNGLGTLNFYRHAKTGNFELWGATGSDGDSHLEHLRYVGEFLQHLPIAKRAHFLGDFTGNGTVDAADLGSWKSAFAASAAGDADGDGDSDGADFLAWQRNLGNVPAQLAALAAVPEAATVRLAAAAVAFLLRSRRRA